MYLSKNFVLLHMRHTLNARKQIRTTIGNARTLVNAQTEECIYYVTLY